MADQQGTWTTVHYLPRPWVQEKYREWTCSSCKVTNMNMSRSHIGSTCMSYMRKICSNFSRGFKNIYPIKIVYLILWNTLIIPTPVETSWGPWKYTIHFMESSLILPLFSKGNTPPIPPWTSEWGQVLQFAILWHPNHMLCLDMSWLWKLT